MWCGLCNDHGFCVAESGWQTENAARLLGPWCSAAAVSDRMRWNSPSRFAQTRGRKSRKQSGHVVHVVYQRKQTAAEEGCRGRTGAASCLRKSAESGESPWSFRWRQMSPTRNGLLLRRRACDVMYGIVERGKSDRGGGAKVIGSAIFFHQNAPFPARHKEKRAGAARHRRRRASRTANYRSRCAARRCVLCNRSCLFAYSVFEWC